MLDTAAVAASAARAAGFPTATITWVSEGERGRPGRRPRRRGSRRAGPPSQTGQQDTAADQPVAGSAPQPAAEDQRPRPSPRLRTVHETSAGGLVVDGIDRPREEQVAALIGRVDRRGRMQWSLPKGHIEQGETAEQTAVREVAEETGIHGHVLAALGSIDFWFVTEGRRVHKTVHHYLLRFSGGELCDSDVEVSEVAWVPVLELPHRLAYADERRLARKAHELIERLQSGGPSALPPLPPAAPWRHHQSHSNTRGHPPRDGSSGGRRSNGRGPGA